MGERVTSSPLRAAALLAALALLAPMAAAFPAAHSGRQDATRWGESALVPAQAGTRFVLAGVAGDHDVRFWDANGQVVGESRACGADQGIVPAGAKLAEVRPWDHAGGVVPKCALPLTLPTGTRFVYIDGL